MSDIEKIINDAWENKDQVNQNSDKSLKDAVNQIIDDLDSGKVRVAEKINGEWVTHQHLCLLYTSPSPRDRQKSRMPSSA